MKRIHSKSIACLALLLLLLAPVARAQVFSDDDLYENARIFRQRKEYAEALAYIFAYLQRNTADFQHNSKHQKQVLDFHEWAVKMVQAERESLARCQAALSDCRGKCPEAASSALTTFSIQLPPPLDPKAGSPDIIRLVPPIALEVRAVPMLVSPGQRTTIVVTARDHHGKPLPDALVTVSAGGGKFLARTAPYDPVSRLHSPYSASGVTDAQGRFITSWVCNPCAAGYGMTATAEKEGFTAAPAKEFTISIKQ